MLTELVSRKVWTMVSTWVARTMRLRIEYFWSERTNSVRSSGTRGSLAPRPEDHLDLGLSFECLGHPSTPKGVQAGDQDPSPHGSAEPDAATLTQHVVDVVLQGCPDVLRLVHHPAPRIPVEARLDVEVDGSRTRSLILAGKYVK